MQRALSCRSAPSLRGNSHRAVARNGLAALPPWVLCGNHPGLDTTEDTDSLFAIGHCVAEMMNGEW